MEYIIKIGIQAQSKPEAEGIVKDLLIIRNALSNEDLKAFAKLLQTNPEIIQTAKKYLG
ncbi:MAG TPA: hypothetical protein VLB84_01035 [Bacteroidia bacterium]|nr:hypothetical protein [Bacteroidia bacterium]